MSLVVCVFLKEISLLILSLPFTSSAARQRSGVDPLLPRRIRRRLPAVRRYAAADPPSSARRAPLPRSAAASPPRATAPLPPHRCTAPPPRPRPGSLFRRWEARDAARRGREAAPWAPPPEKWRGEGKEKRRRGKAQSGKEAGGVESRRPAAPPPPSPPRLAAGRSPWSTGMEEERGKRRTGERKGEGK